jgi:hypothetical protein
MTATYQNNFKKISKYIANPNPSFMVHDPLQYAFRDQEKLHEFLDHSYGPWDNTYASPLTSINLFQVSTVKQISMLPSVFVRDGLFTTVDFFNRLPNPKDIPGIMLVHQSLRDFIPNEWRAKVLFYEIEYRNETLGQFQQKNNQLLLKAFVHDGIFDYEEATKKVLELKKQKFEKFNFFFFNRIDPLLVSEWDHDYRTIEYVKNQTKFISFLEKEKINHEFLTWKEFFNAQNFHQFHCVDLNFKEKYYIDDYTNYLFAKKGATPINPIRQKGHLSDLFVPLSSFHGIRIIGQEPNHNPKKADEIYKNLKLMNFEKKKCTADVFQMIDAVAGKKLDSAWFKIYN